MESLVPVGFPASPKALTHALAAMHATLLQFAPYVLSYYLAGQAAYPYHTLIAALARTPGKQSIGKAFQCLPALTGVEVTAIFSLQVPARRAHLLEEPSAAQREQAAMLEDADRLAAEVGWNKRKWQLPSKGWLRLVAAAA
jgi:hypothetical protein